MSIVFARPQGSFCDADYARLLGADRAAHQAAIDIHNAIHESLPERLKDKAASASLRGLFSALGRLLAECPDRRNAEFLAWNADDCIQREMKYWRGEPASNDRPAEDQFLADVRGALQDVRNAEAGETGKLLTLGQEVGRFTSALIDAPSGLVREQAIQVAALLMSVVVDGDNNANAYRDSRGLDRIGLKDAA